MSFSPVSEPLAILSPYHHTGTSWVSEIRSQLGRGTDQAQALYKSFWKTGQWNTKQPCFTNCPRLQRELERFQPTSPLTLLHTVEEPPHTKCVFALQDGLQIETVVIQMRAGITVCLSSQVGCAMGCAFCETGRMGLLRHLTPSEITAQVWYIEHVLKQHVRNLVFMGMGEPFDNFDAVKQAVAVLTDPVGLGLGPRHITISTVGRVDGIERMQVEMPSGIHLAVSINAPDHATRRKIMPIETTYDLPTLKAALLAYCSKGRSLLLEYILLEGITDAPEHADLLADWIEGLDAKVNCIPYNAQSRARFQTPSDDRIAAFLQRLRDRGISPLLRQHKGRAAMAACGQLGNLDLRKQHLHQLRSASTSSHFSS